MQRLADHTQQIGNLFVHRLRLRDHEQSRPQGPNLRFSAFVDRPSLRCDARHDHVGQRLDFTDVATARRSNRGHRRRKVPARIQLPLAS